LLRRSEATIKYARKATDGRGGKGGAEAVLLNTASHKNSVLAWFFALRGAKRPIIARKNQAKTEPIIPASHNGERRSPPQ